MLHRTIQIQSSCERQISLPALLCLNNSICLQESLQQMNEVGFEESKSYWYKRPCLEEDYFS